MCILSVFPFNSRQKYILRILNPYGVGWHGNHASDIIDVNFNLATKFPSPGSLLPPEMNAQKAHSFPVGRREPGDEVKFPSRNTHS